MNTCRGLCREPGLLQDGGPGRTNRCLQEGLDSETIATRIVSSSTLFNSDVNKLFKTNKIKNTEIQNRTVYGRWSANSLDLGTVGTDGEADTV